MHGLKTSLSTGLCTFCIDLTSKHVLPRNHTLQWLLSQFQRECCCCSPCGGEQLKLYTLQTVALKAKCKVYLIGKRLFCKSGLHTVNWSSIKTDRNISMVSSWPNAKKEMTEINVDKNIQIYLWDLSLDNVWLHLTGTFACTISASGLCGFLI